MKDAEAAGDTGKLEDEDKQLLKYAKPAKVKVVGVWDTVGSVGVAAGNIPGISRSQFDYLQTGLRIPIMNGYHALAIDEHRNDFAQHSGTFAIRRIQKRPSLRPGNCPTSSSAGSSVPMPMLGAAMRPICFPRLRCDG